MADYDDIRLTGILLKKNLKFVYDQAMPIYAKSQGWQLNGADDALPGEAEVKEVLNRYKALNVPRLSADNSLRDVAASDMAYTGTWPGYPPECPGMAAPGGGLLISSDGGLLVPSDGGLLVPSAGGTASPTQPNTYTFEFLGPVADGTQQTIDLTEAIQVAELRFDFVSTTPNRIDIELSVDGSPITVSNPLSFGYSNSYGSLPWEESGGWYLFLMSPVIPAGALTCRIVSSDGILQYCKVSITRS